ncbi:MAG: HD-GYP domain-containing protein (c-di-GMP phosphodiesterase class II) [Cocleimonas sp.]
MTLGAYLHDFGKIVIPDHILNKADALNDNEKQIMNSHAEAGHKMLSQHELTEKIAYLSRYHHESSNGKGYPCSLVKDDIPRGARLVCITDSFDAMTSNRPYRESMSFDNAMDILKSERAIQYGPELVDEFLKLDEHTLQHIIGHSDQNKKLLTCKQCGPVIEKPDEDVRSAYCRVCTGKFDVNHSTDGTAEVEFNGDHGDATELLSEPDMRHVESTFF